MNCRTFLALEGLSREDWLLMRMAWFGGSDTPALFGASPFSSRDKVIQSKVTIKAEETTTAMSRGNEREPIMRAYAADRWSVDVEIPTHSYQHATIDHLGVNLDGWVVSRSNRTKCKGRGVIECKSTNDKRVAQILRGYYNEIDNYYVEPSIPIDYFLQVQHALLVTGVSYGLLVVEYQNGPDKDTFTRYIEPRPTTHSLIIEASAQAWAEVEFLRSQIIAQAQMENYER